MDFRLTLDKWAFWALSGGVCAKSDVNRIGAGDPVFSGECSNKKQGAELIDDDVFLQLHEIFVSLSKNDQEILLVHYRLLPSIPPMQCNKRKANWVGLRLSTYEKRLSRARKNLEVEFERQQK